MNSSNSSISPAYLTNSKEQIREASESIEKTLLLDEITPDVYSSLKTNLNGFYNFQNKTIFNKNLIKINRKINNLFHQKTQFFSGILSNINHIWFSFDNELYLWNYLNDSVTKVAETSQTIITCALVDASKEFIDELNEYIFIISTSIEIILYKITFSQKYNHSKPILTKFKTITSDNVSMLKIKGTKNGRIFMCGKDGNLYEIEYQKLNYFFTKKSKVRKLNHTQNIFSNLIPSIIFGVSKSPIIDIAIDDHRNLIYSLSVDSDIQCWSIGEDGKIMKFITNINNLPLYIKRKNIYRFENDSSIIVKLEVVSHYESIKCFLVAITNNGARVFMTISKSDNALEVLFVRENNMFLPNILKNDKPSNILNDFPVPKDIDQTIYVNGVLLMSSKSNNNLFFISSDSCALYNRLIGETSILDCEKFNNSNSNLNNLLIESFEVEKFDENILDFCEIPRYLYLKDFAYLYYSKNSPCPFFKLSNKSLHHVIPNRIFLILTKNGLNIVVKKRQLDILSAILENDEINMQKIYDYWYSYGSLESCVDCLTLICSSPKPNLYLHLNHLYDFSNNLTTISERVKTFSRSIFFQIFGGYPRKPSSNMIDNSLIADKKDFIESSKLSGVRTYMSRLLRPFWRWTMVINKKNNSVKTYTFTRYSNKDMKALMISILLLYDFLIHYDKMFAQKFVAEYDYINIRNRQGYRENGLQSINNLNSEINDYVIIELERLEGLKKVLTRSIEVIRIMIFLSSSILFFESVFNNLSIIDQRNLLDLPFYKLVSEDKGEETMKSIIESILKNDISKLIYFKSSCPSFFKLNDEYICRGNSLLTKAIENYPDEKYYELLEDANKSFLKALELINKHFPLQEVVDKMKYAHNYSGIIMICLKFLEVIGDDDNDANSKERCQVIIMNAFYDLLDKKSDINSDNKSPIKWTISNRESQLMRMKHEILKLENKQLHFKLYDFLIYNDFDLFFMQFSPSSKYIEPYLISSCKNNSKTANFMFTLYSNKQKYFEASSLAYYWATSTFEKCGVKLNIMERQSFILKSLRYSRSISNPSTTESHFLVKINRVRKKTGIQLKIRSAINKIDGANAFKKTDILEKLEFDLICFNDLYNIAVNYELFHICLEIHDSDLLEYKSTNCLFVLWDRIISKEIELHINKESIKKEKYTKSKNWVEPLKLVVKNYACKYKEAKTFPLDYIIFKLEQANVSFNSQPYNWIVDIFEGSKFGAIDVIEGYASIIDNMDSNIDMKEFFTDSSSINLIIESVIQSINWLLNINSKKRTYITERDQKVAKKLILWTENKLLDRNNIDKSNKLSDLKKILKDQTIVEI